MNVIVFQPALPHYRLGFFKRVFSVLGSRFVVFYSPTELSGMSSESDGEPWAQAIGSIVSIGPGLNWQKGALAIPIGAGDVVIVSGAPRTISTLVLIAKAKLCGAKVIWWGHFWSSSSKHWRFWLRMQLLRFCDGVLFYSDDEVKDYRRNPIWGSQRIVRGLNNGIETEVIASVREPFEPNRRDNAILFVGRLTRKADLSLALRALALIPEVLRPRLDVVGSGEERLQLLQLARVLGVERSVVWHGAIVDEVQIASIANRCRLFVYPGQVGLSLVHAMAYGLPAVVHSTKSKQMPEIAAFQNSVTGQSFEFGNAESLAKVLVDMSSNLETLAAYSESALSRIEETFNAEDMAARFVSMVCGLSSDSDLLEHASRRSNIVNSDRCGQ